MWLVVGATRRWGVSRVMAVMVGDLPLVESLAGIVATLIFSVHNSMIPLFMVLILFLAVMASWAGVNALHLYHTGGAMGLADEQPTRAAMDDGYIADRVAGSVRHRMAAWQYWRHWMPACRTGCR